MLRRNWFKTVFGFCSLGLISSLSKFKPEAAIAVGDGACGRSNVTKAYNETFCYVTYLPWVGCEPGTSRLRLLGVYRDSSRTSVITKTNLIYVLATGMNSSIETHEVNIDPRDWLTGVNRDRLAGTELEYFDTFKGEFTTPVDYQQSLLRRYNAAISLPYASPF